MWATPPTTPTTSNATRTLIGAGGPGVEQRRAGETYRHFQERRDEACVGWGQKPASVPTHAQETPIHAGDDASGFPSGNMDEWGTQFNQEQGGDMQPEQQHYAHYPPPPTGAQVWEQQAGTEPYIGTKAQPTPPSSFRGKANVPPRTAGFGGANSGNNGGGGQFDHPNIPPT